MIGLDSIIGGDTSIRSESMRESGMDGGLTLGRRKNGKRRNRRLGENSSMYSQSMPGNPDYEEDDEDYEDEEEDDEYDEASVANGGDRESTVYNEPASIVIPLAPAH